ncbi:protein kinase family protein [Rhynchospora pubera]|uniref:Protein kinase family protein n=1 Tax=Rhynchospora pubera TaxID=906938 RepID=A0AAV8HA93_9POAL|nr:protein kinase family protein [Rhynchospora pubera]
MRSSLARLCFKQRRKDEDLQHFAPWYSSTKGDGTAPQLNDARYFSFEELKECTDNFSENNKIGADGYGKVYKGYCSNGVVVAIKRIRTLNDRKEIESEIEVSSRVHHKNIVSLVGFCLEQGEMLLVYEYISKGSLRDNLVGKSGTYLDWKKRLQIALDSARALAYLHELATPLIIHRDVKSLNILLDENLNAKVADFVLSKMVSEKEKGHVSSQGRGILAQVEDELVAGTFGYLDPEYFSTGTLSEKSDVYSFGVVMLELLTARGPIIFIPGQDGGNYLIEEVNRAIDENDQEFYGLRDIIDPKIVNQVTNVGLRKFVQLALECLKPSGSDRPSMYEIMKEIDIILQLDGSEQVNNC